MAAPGRELACDGEADGRGPGAGATAQSLGGAASQPTSAGRGRRIAVAEAGEMCRRATWHGAPPRI